jgi:hypothetical protein
VVVVVVVVVAKVTVDGKTAHHLLSLCSHRHMNTNPPHVFFLFVCLYLLSSIIISAENMLICAPTGAGKTNCAMLAVLQLVGQHVDRETGVLDRSLLKCCYIAPMKALAQEVTDDGTVCVCHMGVDRLLLVLLLLLLMLPPPGAISPFLHRFRPSIVALFGLHHLTSSFIYRSLSFFLLSYFSFFPRWWRRSSAASRGLAWWCES